MGVTFNRFKKKTLHYIFVVTVAFDRGKCRKVATLDGEYFQAGNWANYHLDENKQEIGTYCNVRK